jgi:hypothetical protein
VANPETEAVEYYEASGLRVVERVAGDDEKSPPYYGVPPTLEMYRARGHRRLLRNTYDEKCADCIWAADMAVQMIIDQWNPSEARYRRETFCYGPKSCRFYVAGPARRVPGRKGMSWTEENWVDEDATSHRGPDD